MGQPILVVDDDSDTRVALRLMLEDAGYTVAEAGDGTGALDQLRASPRGMVVLLDNLMPGLEGAEVLAELDGDGTAARHAFLLITASPQYVTGDLAERLAHLAGSVISKPFEMDDLLATVARAARHLEP